LYVLFSIQVHISVPQQLLSQDLAFTARLTGLDKDFQKTKINMNDIRNQVAAARKEDREAQREAGDIIMRTLGDNQKSAYRRAVTMIMEKLHVLFAGHIIYRTHRSRDLSGKLINGLPPYVERSLAIRPNKIDCEFNDMLRQRLGDDIEKKKKSRKRVSPALGQVRKHSYLVYMLVWLHYIHSELRVCCGI
jgi:hypothetical protein